MNYETYEVKIYDNGAEHWYQNGNRHRLNGPAVIYSNGYEAWYQNGNRHRLNGPAVIYSDGSKYWYQDNILHRLNGPAVEYSNGGKFWCIEGTNYTEQEFNKKVQELNNPDPCDGKVIKYEGKKYKLVKV